MKLGEGSTGGLSSESDEADLAFSPWLQSESNPTFLGRIETPHICLHSLPLVDTLQSPR